MWLDILIPRNGFYVEDWQLTDVGKSPIDLTAYTLECHARNVGGGVILTAASLPIIDAPLGIFQMQWSGAGFDDFGDPQAIARAYYDLRLNHLPSASSKIVVRGHLLLHPGATV